MAQTWDSRRLRIERMADRAFVDDMRTLGRAAGAIVARAASATDTDGNAIVPDTRPARDALANALWRQTLQPYFIGPGGEAFDGPAPRSPYATLITRHIEQATRVQVAREVALVRRAVADADVVAWLTGPRPADLAREQYDPFHRFVDPNGYRLSDRVWRTAIDTRARIDLLLDYHIRRGTPAVQIARELEEFLTPGAGAQRTVRPYGREGSYAARRLARTEISAAAGRAAVNAAEANPFVNGMQWALSRAHACCDICDDYARGGPNGDGIYPVDQFPRYPAHPNCVLPGQLVTTRRGDVPIEEVQAGDRVLTHLGRWQRVTAAWSTPHDGPVYEIATGRTRLELTGNHPVLTRRGWVNAEELHLGDQILHAGIGVGTDGLAVVSEHAPAAAFNPGIASDVVADFGLVPPRAVALDPNLLIDQGKVDVIASDPVFSGIDDAGTVEGLRHFGFCSSGIFEPEPLMAFEHGQEAGIVPALGRRDFAGDFGPLGGIVFAREVDPGHGGAHLVSGGTTTGSIVFCPLCLDGFAAAAHGDPALVQKSAQDTVGDAVHPEYVRGGHCLIDVNIDQQLLDGDAVFLLQAEAVKFESGDTVKLKVRAGDAFLGDTTNGADKHDSLLSLSPDYRGGRGSGNPLVSEIANPTQAHLHYRPIEAIRQRHYTGPVYNMEVQTDHSYTVNGVAVHNCMCTARPVPLGDTRDLALRLRDEIRRRSPVARQMQGLLNPDWLVAAILSGQLLDWLQRNREPLRRLRDVDEWEEAAA